MFDLLRRNLPMIGSVFYLGTLPPRHEEFAGLARKGFELGPVQQGEKRGDWMATLSHPKIGDAELVCFAKPMLPPRILIEMDPRLSPEEKVAVIGCGSMVTIRMQSRKKNMLRDRKNMLRVLAALMGKEGVACLDHAAERFWSRAELKEELAHRADLDIESLYTVHMVGDDDDEERVIWYHTHGLASLGIWDIDILEPGDPGHPNFGDTVRVLAFEMLAGDAKPGGVTKIAQPGGAVRLVDAATFNSTAAARWAQLREDPDGDHTEQRVVLCEPGGGGGVFGLFKKGVAPARWLRGEMRDGMLLNFSEEATNLMSERAAATLPMLERYADELRELEAMPIAKIGYGVDHGLPGQREHLWFEVHGFHGDTLDATLLNQPHDIAALNQGDRGHHPVDQLSDWMLMTPIGTVTPRHTAPVRFFRDRRDEIMAALAEG